MDHRATSPSQAGRGMPLAAMGMAFALGVALLALPSASGARAEDLRPRLTVEVLDSLQFGQVTTDAGRGGTVIVEPVTGRKTVHGGAIDLHGHHRPARFLVTGPPHAPFVITLPQTVELAAGSDGRAVMRDFVSVPAGEGRLGVHGEAIIEVGATLTLDPGTVGVSLSGSFAIHVDPAD